MRLTRDDLLIIALPTITTALVVGFFVWAIRWYEQDAKAWAEFTAQHVCERTQHTKPGYYITSFVNNMPIMTWVPGQVLFKCDDGKEYWRNQ